MRQHFSRTTSCLLMVSCCWALAINAFAIHENRKDFDFEFDEFAGESSVSSASLAATAVDTDGDGSSEEEDNDEELEQHAEMLPANFENVEPPGVDHMEINAEVAAPSVKMMREYHGKMVEV